MQLLSLARILGRFLLLMATSWGSNVQAQEQTCPDPLIIAGQRLVAVISDLHFGRGPRADRSWYPQEDFRWSAALRSFLDSISKCGRDKVDLVIAGDLLELWQPPEGTTCKGAASDLGCTPKEFTKIASAIVNAHASDLEVLGRFADRGGNRVYLVPGNHDAALLLPETWKVVSAAMKSKRNRVTRVDSGVWKSANGQVIVEHGHQIGNDVNRYGEWPRIVREVNGQQFVERPWGERFVQQLFNAEEVEYPIIDNLGPETAGARYRMADRGLWRSATDVARFIAFNLFETSLAQKGQFLGGSADPESSLSPWDLTIGRRLGHRLFADSLEANDPFRLSLLSDTPQGAELRAELDRLANDPQELPNAQVELLCDHMSVRTDAARRCQSDTLGALCERLFRSKKAVFTEHLRSRLQDRKYQQMRVFVYAHTHQLEEEWPVQVTDLREVKVFNAGAFQRVIDEPGFLALAAKRHLEPFEALRRLSVEDLAPCYSAVLVALSGKASVGRTIQWHMEESGVGRFLAVGDVACR